MDSAMTKASESLFVVPMGKADPEKVKELSDRLLNAYMKLGGQQVFVADNSNELTIPGRRSPSSRFPSAAICYQARFHHLQVCPRHTRTCATPAEVRTAHRLLNRIAFLRPVERDIRDLTFDPNFDSTIRHDLHLDCYLN